MDSKLRSDRASEVRGRLLAWYDAHKRDLPWRAHGGDWVDPYRVWLSEVMLQQTQVETVKPYYERWLQRFPTLGSLADASLDDVLKSWEGLGYYSRARNLHRAVREVVHTYGGEVPDDPVLFRALPGVGRYTAGAVQSIAFGRAEPLVDGNVRRVFARWRDDPRPADAMLWEMAEGLVPGARPGDLNQSLMELGATVCTPRAPRCGECPVRDFCAAYAAGTQEIRPLPKKARTIPHEEEAVAVVEHGGRVLIARRPAAWRLGGLWEFPGILLKAGESAPAGACRAALDGVGLRVIARESIGVVKHTFTHVKVSYHAIRCEVLEDSAEPLRYDAVAWAAPAELNAYAIPVAHRKIAKLAWERTLFA